VKAPSLVWLAALAVEVAGDLEAVNLQRIDDVVSAAVDAGDDPADTAGVLVYEIVRRMPLPRRNARFAVLAADRWLDDHGLRLSPDDCNTAVKLLGAVSAGQAELGEVTTWVHAHVSACEEATMFERFTEPARQVLVVAQEEASGLHHGWIGTEHILLGLVSQREALGGQVLAALGVDLEVARARVIAIVGTGEHDVDGAPPFTARAKKVLELSLREALAFGHNYIGTEHMVLGLLREGEGVGAQVLESGFGLSLNRLREEVIQRLPAMPPVRSGRRRDRLGRPTRGKEPSAKLCSFCGKSCQEVTKIIAGPGVSICNECIVLCNEIMAEELGRPAAPSCPRCGRSIGDDARTETLELAGDSPREVRVLFCGGCGATLGTVA
jgi:hypothetical protein